MTKHLLTILKAACFLGALVATQWLVADSLSGMIGWGSALVLQIAALLMLPGPLWPFGAPGGSSSVPRR